MKTISSLAAIATLAAAPVLAESHLSDGAMMGEADFTRCQTCHVVQDEEGNILAGKRSKTGPNLYGIMGAPMGSVEGYRYGPGLLAAKEAGLVWTEENMIAWLVDPKAFLKGLELDKDRTKMTYRVRADRKTDRSAEDVARNYADFLKEIGPQMPEAETEAEAEEVETN
ncbi:Cytochrome c2 [Candidatus Rhodobacter oscarellae]|uniref:Cytochrome c2 n=1 Tax=Candidatus Rhodobacter oscarellae TaxID=1675527 RepID=A0A0J9ECQ8_9RHOB|nr:hypothetical protein [Candidatus Rhodobacter lobularis]KMW60567.1 Cytochrome c2 [Candidatus Rhodobacter lobularis]